MAVILKSAIRHVIFILTFVCSITSVCGQVKGNLTDLTGIQRVDSIAQIWGQIDDSLRLEFYRQPKFFTLFYEKNGKRQKLKNSKFIVLVDTIAREISAADSNRYPMNFQVDSSQKVILKLSVNGTTIQQELFRATAIQNGATVVFGEITDLPKWFKKGRKELRYQDPELYYVDKLYDSLLTASDVKDLMLQRKRPIFQYLRVSPRVYGCGTVTQYVKLKEKLPPTKN